MKINDIIGQGDVFLTRIPALPRGCKRKDNVLAHGETTGHKHQVVGKAQVYELEGKQYVEVHEQSVLQHEEHNHQQLMPGIYEVELQREFDLVQGIRQVMD